jgi:serine/threonine-protein kinase
MSPEQGMGRNVDHSLGITLYEMVTGRKPYLADTPMAVLYKQMTDPLPRPGKFVPGLPVEIERILFKALAKLPAERYQFMREFEKALENQLVEQGVKSVSIPKQPRENIKPQRSRSSVSLIRLILPIILAVITISLSVLFILTRQTQSLAEGLSPCQ